MRRLRGLAFLIVLAAAGAWSAPAAATDTVVISDADRMVYHSRTRVIEATGRPHLTYLYYTLDADEVTYEIDPGLITATGNVVMDDGQMVISGSALAYDNLGRSGIVKDSRTTVLPWRFRAEETVRRGPRWDAENVYMTTCDDSDPHYEIWASSSTLYPNSRLVLRNLVLYAGRVPVFYFPIYTRLLKDPWERWHVRPGYNKREGTFVKVSYDYDVGDNLEGSLYADYFQRRGIGTGLDARWTPKHGRHYLYFYHIGEKPILYNDQTGKYYNPELPRSDNWKLYGTAWQEFSDERVALAYLNYLKQNDFNNQYNEGLTNRVERTLESWAAFTQTRDDYTWRLSGEKDWNWDDARRTFAVTNEELPRLKFHWNTHPLARPERLHYQFDANLARTRTSAEDFSKLSAEGEFQLLRNFTPTDRSGLTLRAGFNELWEDRRSLDDKDDRTTARLLAGGDYDYNFTDHLKGRLWYNYRRRLNNREGMDFNGEEESLLQGGVFGYARPRLQYFLIQGFDARGDTSGNGFRSRFEPLRLGARWRPVRQLNLTGEVFYDWATERVSGLASENAWQATERVAVNLNAYHVDNPDGRNVTDFEGGLGWTFGNEDAWRLNALATWNLQGHHFKEETLILTRRLHCWEAHLVFSDRSNGDREVWFLVNLTDYQQRKLGMYRNIDSSKFSLTGSAFSSLYQ